MRPHPSPQLCGQESGELYTVALHRDIHIDVRLLKKEVAGREEALSLARQAYIPDFSLSASFTAISRSRSSTLRAQEKAMLHP